MNGQLNLFDFIECEEPYKTKDFNVLESLALYGTGFHDGMKRVYDFFTHEHSLKEKAQFLKKEYGLGAFGTPKQKPNFIHGFDTFGSGKKPIRVEYFDSEMNNIEEFYTFEDLAKTITNMIKNGTYKRK